METSVSPNVGAWRLRCAVLGAGAWGTALSKILGDEGHAVSLWTRSASQARRIGAERANEAFLPQVSLPEAVCSTHVLADALRDADCVVVAVPTVAVRAVLSRLNGLLRTEIPIVCASKGIEQGSLLLLHQVAAEALSPNWASQFVILSGPSFAMEVARGSPTNVVAASPDAALVKRVQGYFGTERFRVYSSGDWVGVQVGGALKNVIAIAAGACDGLGFGHNTRAAVITRGLAELARLAVALSGDRISLAGLAGLGDLVLTCTGELSRNRQVGLAIGRGRSLKDALGELGHVAEGVPTAESAFALARKLDVELPICGEVYRVLYEDKAPQEAVKDVLSRPLRGEWD